MHDPIHEKKNHIIQTIQSWCIIDNNKKYCESSDRFFTRGTCVHINTGCWKSLNTFHTREFTWQLDLLNVS